MNGTNGTHGTHGTNGTNGTNGANGTDGASSAHEEPRYVRFHHLEDGAVNEDGALRLNKFSSTLTRGHNFPGAQVSQSSLPGR